MRVDGGDSNSLSNDMRMSDGLDGVPMFSTTEIEIAAKESNFNKGLGPDGFDGNVLKNSE